MCVCCLFCEVHISYTYTIILLLHSYKQSNSSYFKFKKTENNLSHSFTPPLSKCDIIPNKWSQSKAETNISQRSKYEFTKAYLHQDPSL